MLRSQVESFIARHRLMAAGETVVVAVSGGADSLCLLLLLHELAPGLRLRLHVAHLDHLLRRDSAADAVFVAEVARRLDLPATVAARDVQAVRRAQGLSLEAAARRVRYAFLGEVAAETGAARVAVGHTADDQAETVLLHLIRGAGLAGLRGILPLTRLRLPEVAAPLTIVRPLLEVDRRQTVRCCQERGYEPRQDPTNWSLDFLRNRVRRELIPLLEASYNPAVRLALRRTARAVADDLDHLLAEVEQVWPRVARERPGSVEITIAGLDAISRSLRRHLLRRAFCRLAGAGEELGADHVERLLQALDQPRTGIKLDLPGDVVFAIADGVAVFEERPRARARSDEVPLPLPVEGPLTIPGRTRLGAWTVDARLDPAGGSVESGRWSTSLDFDQTGPTLRVRRRRPGDRFQPLGMGGLKRLQDFFVDARVPRAWRDRVPVVETPQGIAWVAGWRIDERFKVRPETRTILKLEFKRDDVAERTDRSDIAQRGADSGASAGAGRDDHS